MSDETWVPDAKWIEEAEIASDRAAAISMTALLELVLADAIRACFIELSNTQDDNLFNDRGPLSTLYSKIDIGHALGLYGNETRNLLHSIRRIRNRFAHHHDATHFGQEEILRLCDALPQKSARGSALSGPRDRFNHAVIRTGFELSRVSLLREAERPTPPN